MDATRQTDSTQATKGAPLPGLLKPPIVFLAAILLGIALNRAWSLPFLPWTVRLLGPLVTACAILLFLFSFQEFRAAGTSVRGSERSTTMGNRSLPLQSQSHLSVFHFARARIIGLAE